MSPRWGDLGLWTSHMLHKCRPAGDGSLDFTHATQMSPRWGDLGLWTSHMLHKCRPAGETWVFGLHTCYTNVAPLGRPGSLDFTHATQMSPRWGDLGLWTSHMLHKCRPAGETWVFGLHTCYTNVAPLGLRSLGFTHATQMPPRWGNQRAYIHGVFYRRPERCFHLRTHFLLRKTHPFFLNCLIAS